MASKSLIAIVGLPASGKTSAIEGIKDIGTIVTMGDIIREEALHQGLEPTSENIGKLAKSLRNDHGEDIIAQRCIDKIQNLTDKIILIDGIRSTAEVERFRERWKLYVIAITTPEEIRFNRILKRGRSDDPTNIDQILERDRRELQFGLREVIDNAEFVIINNQDVSSLQKKIKKLVEELLA
ncbi:MAG: flagellar hook-basal body complex protein FliE [Candidatus Lokiarchaeota archaeon]|nr:flagellar hook-basal body complex protein FliE [Candidatus Lokiarchaeota archaeon]